jgi:hypothetical protein
MVEKKRFYDIDVTLSGEAEKHFLAIKRAKGLKDDSEVLKFIINRLFEEIERKRQGGSLEIH